jgi:hypothetical protein
MHDAAATADPPRLEWVFPARLMPFWVAVIVSAWWQRLAREPALAAAGAATLAAVLVVRALGWLAEAAWYAMLWRTRGRRVPVMRLAAAIATFSMFDLLALGLRDVPAWAGSGAVTVLSGLEAAPGDGPLALAAGGFGACALARMVCTAAAQVRALGTSAARPLAFTLASTAAARVALVLGVSLAQGRSPW